uniref:TLDc domain-containing protein n=1 Tax=Entamoeba invadens TaxID=33085 RepID=S0B1T6_ENTIV|nr:hypothetical protein [Entamoeba invadens]
MDLSVLQYMTTNEGLKRQLNEIIPRYEAIVSDINTDYIAGCKAVSMFDVDKEPLDKLKTRLGEISALKQQKLSSITAISHLSDRFGAFEKMKNNEIEQKRILDGIEARIRQKLDGVGQRYPPPMYAYQQDNNYSPNQYGDAYQRQPDRFYDKKPRIEGDNDYDGHRSPKPFSERPITEELIINSMPKILTRVNRGKAVCIYDTSVDGWDRNYMCDVVTRFKDVMIIVFPEEDRPFGCYLEGRVSPHGWYGNEKCFLCAMHGNDFFWVHGVNRRITRCLEFFRFGEKDEDDIFFFTHFISIAGKKTQKKSYIDSKILDVVRQKTGTFIGEGASRSFDTRKVIALHFE